MEKFYFVMPAYNEEANIAKTIEQWYTLVEKINQIDDCEARLAIADDGSKDNTLAVMSKIKAKKNLVFFLPLTKPNGGHGQTVLYLYRYALENDADFIFQTDSDGQTNPEEFWPMFEHRHDFDFQIGYRKGRQDGLGRIFVTKTLRMLVWLVFHVWVTDPNTPFRLMQKNKLRTILEVIPKDYFLCNVAISAIAIKWKYRVKFYEITFKPRQGGVNSINMRRIFKIGWKALGDFRRINLNLRKTND